MKKCFRILAVVLAATMLMCCCAFATGGGQYYQGGYVTYYCSCGGTAASASTTYDIIGPERSVNLSVQYQYYEGGQKVIGYDGDSTENVSGDATASCSYASSFKVYAYSSHNVSPSWTGSASDRYE